MIKKHLTACSVLLVVMISSKTLVTRSAVRLEAFPKKSDLPREEQKEQNVEKEADEYRLTFADEELPLHNPKVSARIKRTLKAHSYEKLQTNVLHREAEKWFPVIEPILKEHNIPEDFKYMPLVESGLKHGTSPKGAAGYWQFMPGTARSYGLKVNSQVDERLNMRKSTIAACRYLNDLYDEFGSWTLAAAAYNVGENRIWRQIRQQNHRNYFKMDLNTETASYVYKLVSMKEIIEHPAKHGYSLWHRRLLAKKDTRKKFIQPHQGHSTITALQQF